MTNELKALLNRAAAALETPDDLASLDKQKLIEDLVAATLLVHDQQSPNKPVATVLVYQINPYVGKQMRLVKYDAQHLQLGDHCLYLAPHVTEPLAWISDTGLESLRKFGQASIVAGPARTQLSEYKYPIYLTPQPNPPAPEQEK